MFFRPHTPEERAELERKIESVEKEIVERELYQARLRNELKEGRYISDPAVIKEAVAKVKSWPRKKKQ